jgi:hypothetical protein
MIYLAFYVPASHLEIVKSAVFAAGAGRIGNYEHCSFETPGVGQFKALAGSNPRLGQQGVLEKVNEIKVEVVCQDDCLSQVIEALRYTHPYETPAYHALKTLDI